MQLRNQVEWAIHCCVLLSGLPPGVHLGTKKLAEFHGVPKEYLSKALQALAQDGILTGTLGPTGGYRLAREAVKISCLDIVEAIEGKRRTFVCEEIRLNNPCLKGAERKPKAVCGIARVMYGADEAWRNELRSTTVADLAETLQQTVSGETLDRSQEWLAKKSSI